MADRPSVRSRATRRSRRGFTVLELVVAGVVATIIVGALTLSLSRLGRARSATTVRLDGHMRANAAIEALRRDIASTLRSDDLFNTRLLILDGSAGSVVGTLDRDELLLFSARFAAVRANRYQGEGSEYETQFRIEEDALGAALWQRRDPFPDRWPDAGGMATPIVDGIVALNLEAYDGEAWYPDWDSDVHGLPWAIRITVTAVGQRVGDDAEIDPRMLVTLRTVVAIDRIIPPAGEEDEEDKEAAAEEAAGATDEGLVPGGVAAPGDGGTGVGGGGDVGGGGGRPGGGGPPTAGGGRGGGGGGGAIGGGGRGGGATGVGRVGRGSRAAPTPTSRGPQ